MHGASSRRRQQALAVQVEAQYLQKGQVSTRSINDLREVCLVESLPQAVVGGCEDKMVALGAAVDIDVGDTTADTATDRRTLRYVC